jgi:Tfp pilus assembly protein PilV
MPHHMQRDGRPDACSAKLGTRQRGTTLLEALVAFLVLSLGMLTVARVQTGLRLHAEAARQRSEAVRLGQEDIESLRAYSIFEHPAGVASGPARSYTDVASRTTAVDTTPGLAVATRYTVTRQVGAASARNAKDVSVRVGWTDRGGNAHRVALDSLIAGNDPGGSGALTLAPAGTPVRGAYGRSAHIPLVAKDLGDGRSVLKPTTTAGVAWLFDNATGQVAGRCSGINPTTGSADLGPADLTTCDTQRGLLITGSVRYTQATPPDPAHADDPPLAATVAIAVTGSGYPRAAECASEALKTVRATGPAGLRFDAVPLAALPSGHGAGNWVETGDRYLGYRCVVYPAGGLWSGRIDLAPAGWTLGSGAADKRVCRYAADLDGSGAVDTNLEHPAVYANVDSSLAQQNFLVIAGNQTCPTAATLRVLGSAGDVTADRSTVQHQP